MQDTLLLMCHFRSYAPRLLVGYPYSLSSLEIFRSALYCGTICLIPAYVQKNLFADQYEFSIIDGFDVSEEGSYQKILATSFVPRSFI